MKNEMSTRGVPRDIVFPYSLSLEGRGIKGEGAIGIDAAIPVTGPIPI
jgi:hypothetical protein